MKDLFPGFYPRSDKEIQKLWQEAIFVFDANMFLNVYRYKDETRERFFELLEGLQSRIWAPNQSLYEYHDNRVRVIDQQIQMYDTVIQTLNNAKAILKDLQSTQKRRNFIDIDEMVKEPIQLLESAAQKSSESKLEKTTLIENLKHSDPYREKLSQLFQGRVGKAYTSKALQDLYRQIDKRYELQIPPGWEDQGKQTYGKYGDAILWFQLIDFVKVNKKPVIFVTDDTKLDWFVSSEKKKFPRPELIQEMHVETGKAVHIIQGFEFVYQAARYLDLTPNPSIVKDAEEVSVQNASAKYNETPTFSPYVRITLQDVVESVIQWLLKFSELEPFEDIRIDRSNLSADADIIIDNSPYTVHIIPFDKQPISRIFSRISALIKGEERVHFDILVVAAIDSGKQAILSSMIDDLIKMTPKYPPIDGPDYQSIITGSYFEGIFIPFRAYLGRDAKKVRSTFSGIVKEF